MKGIMLQGTSSDVGKSVLCTALCRLLHDRGLKVAPFKSQNMSNNSYVTKDGSEIGRAQGIQAEAANIEPSVFMNPILLKPRSDCLSEVIYFGKAYQSFSAQHYRSQFYELGLAAITKAKEKLSEQFDYLVVEGAGSPVEINLNDREIVNMKVAELLNIPVILVADIDRGGVFASIVGTLQLLTEKERERVKGIIINKFRGDPSLFEDGIEWLQSYTGKPILGVIPHISDLTIEAEDSLAIPIMETKHKGEIDIAVIKLPYVSNFTDLEPFRFEKDVSIRFIHHADDFGYPDAIIIPGTKSTINDLKYLKENKLEEAISTYYNNGGRVVGICGGYQMLGYEIVDNAGTDTGLVGYKETGLKLLPIITYFQEEKQVQHSHGSITIANKKIAVNGYEIHLGITKQLPLAKGNFVSFIDTTQGKDGLIDDTGRLIGTYFHHLFHNDEWRNYWLNEIRREKGLLEKVSSAWETYEKKKEAGYNHLAKVVESHLEVDKVLKIIEEWGHTRCSGR